jgi:hypothetical protein
VWCGVVWCGVGAGMTLKTHDKCKQVAEKLKSKEHIFVLGKGFAEPIAYEGMRPPAPSLSLFLSLCDCLM